MLRKILENYIVENLEFQIQNDKIEDFLKNDYEIWTKFLSKQPGFLRKETWISKEKIGNIKTIVHWENLNCWKNIKSADLIQNENKFNQKMKHGIIKNFEQLYLKNQYEISYIWEKKGINFETMKNSLDLNILDKPYAIEELVFKTDPENIENFIKIDYEIWTKKLSENKSFLRKEVWISKTIPGEIRTVIYWSDYEEWKSFDHVALMETGKLFDEKIGIENYSFVDAPHDKNQFYKVNFVRK